MYDVNLETCEIVESPEGRLTRRQAALLAYHVAVDKLNHWSAVKQDAWAVFEAESAKLEAATTAPRPA